MRITNLLIRVSVPNNAFRGLAQFGLLHKHVPIQAFGSVSYPVFVMSHDISLNSLDTPDSYKDRVVFGLLSRDFASFPRV